MVTYPYRVPGRSGDWLGHEAGIVKGQFSWVRLGPHRVEAQMPSNFVFRHFCKVGLFVLGIFGTLGVLLVGLLY